MKYDKKRERRRKELARYEMERMLRRYPEECGECLVRQTTDRRTESAEEKDEKEEQR